MKKVLYAEDEFTNRKLLEIHLKNSGYACDLAVDGIDALSKFKTNSYDLVILDQYMPGMTGKEAAVEIRRLDPDIPIIGITSDDAEKENLLELGFDQVFIKPLRNQNYKELIDEFLTLETE